MDCQLITVQFIYSVLSCYWISDGNWAKDCNTSCAILLDAVKQFSG